MSYWTHINEYWIMNALEGNLKIFSKAYAIILTENETIFNGFNYLDVKYSKKNCVSAAWCDVGFQK